MMRRIILLALIAALMFIDAAQASDAVTLTIAGDVGTEELYDAFMREHPNIRIVRLDELESSALIQDALSHSDAVDVYSMYTLLSPTYQSLRDRGYFLTLDDPELQVMADSVYPELQEALCYRGELCALPFSVQIQQILGVNLDCWRALGLTEDELPATWAEMLRFAVEQWPQLAGDHEDIRLFDSATADSLLHDIENNYAAYRARGNYAMGYDTPEFREILDLFSRLIGIEVLSIDEQIDDEQQVRALFCNDYVPNANFCAPDVDEQRALRLSFREGESPCLAVGLMVMAINPNTAHANEAMELIKYIFQNNDPIEKLLLCPEENEPIISENYLVAQEEYAREMQAYEARIAAAEDESERRALELERDDYDRDKQNYFAVYKYRASEESIRRCREEVEGSMVPIYDESIRPEEYGAVNDMRIAYLHGHISADQYIHELERRFVFSALEGQ